MINKQKTQNKYRKLCEWDNDTKQLLDEKTEEFRLSSNKVVELCLQRYLPEMRLWT